MTDNCPTCDIPIDEKGFHLELPKGSGHPGWNGHIKKDEDGVIRHYLERQP